MKPALIPTNFRIFVVIVLVNFLVRIGVSIEQRSLFKLTPHAILIAIGNNDILLVENKFFQVYIVRNYTILAVTTLRLFLVVPASGESDFL
jgi:hypothetical protein